MKENDLIFVPFTSKMNSLEKILYDELMKEVKEYSRITIEWLKTEDGQEFLSRGKNYRAKRKSIISILKAHHIKRANIMKTLRLNHSIGRSYAHRSIGKMAEDLDNDDWECLRQIYNGVSDIMDSFEETLIAEIMFLLNELWEEIVDLAYALNKLPYNHYTTNITPKVRAEMIARTEMQRSFNGGVLQTYAKYGIELIEIVNYTDVGLCETCKELIRGSPYSIVEVSHLLPVHPNCKCFAVAYVLPDKELVKVDDPIIIDMFS